MERTGLGRTGLRWVVSSAVFVLGLLAVGTAGPARAEEAPADPAENLARVVAWEAQVAEHAAAKDLDALAKDAEDGVEVHAALPEKDPLRVRVVKAIGALCKNRSKDLAKKALDALGNTRDPAAASYLRSHLKPTEDPDPPPTLRAAIEAAGKVGDDSLVDPLLLIVDDSKNHDVAGAALTALGGFRGCKRKREKILEEVTKSILRDRPGVRASAKEGGSGDYVGGRDSEAGGRWKVLTSLLPESLNALTGRTLTSAEDWLTTV
jgi:HEAT repeat protein